MRKGVAVLALALTSSCGADSISSPEDTSYLATLVSLAMHADAGSYGGLTNLIGATAMPAPAFDPGACRYDGPSAGFACAPQLADHFTYTLRFFLFDAQGRPIEQFKANTASSARVFIDVSGTYVSPYMEPAVKVSHHTVATLEGLATSVVTINGTVTYNDVMGTAPYTSSTSVQGTAKDVRLPMTAGAFPESGTLVTSYLNQSSSSSDYLKIDSIVTFNGTNRVPVSIDYPNRHLECTGDLSRQFGTPCQ